MLVSKTLGDEMKKVLDDPIKMVNFIKQRQIDSRMFKKIVWKLEQTAHLHIAEEGVGMAQSV
jgi:hypothetical protein